ncbi:MAG: hypothetical protein HY547_07185 [Elusimicrobia bacterium]|nr:hypothetical protein [Elusimicrobiota bacterium]
MISSFAFSGLLAAFISGSLALTLKRLAQILGLVSIVKGDRWRTEPIPLLGGIAVFLGTLAGYLLPHWLAPSSAIPDPHSWAMTAVVLGGSAAALAIGLIDDKIHLLPHTKLMWQIFLGIAAVGLGLRFRVSGWALADSALSVLWLVTTMNAVNLIDNMDGLAAGVASIASISVMTAMMASQQPLPVALLAAFSGGCLGFLIHNFPPAKIFLGDAGSLWIGFFLGSVTMIQTNGEARGLAGSLILPALFLLLPIFDMAFVSLNRILHNRSPFTGGRDHTSHRLIVAGLSERKALMVFYLLSASGGLLSVVSLKDFSVLWLMGLLLVLVCGLLAAYLSQIRVYGDMDFVQESTRPHFSVPRFIPHKRQIIGLLLDFNLIVIAYFVSYLLRFEEHFFDYWEIFVKSLPVVLPLQMTSLWWGGVYRSSFRHSSIWDIVTIVKSVTLGSVLSALAVLFIWRFESFSRSVFIVDCILLIAMICSFRLAFRLLDQVFWGQRSSVEDLAPVVIYGAGDQGETMARTMMQNAALGRLPVGFIDDDYNKQGLRIHGIRVWGNSNQLDDLITKFAIQEVVISSNKISGHNREKIKKICKDKNVAIKSPVWSFDLIS